MMARFVELLSTLAGVRGLFHKFVVGQGLRTASALFAAFRRVFDFFSTSTELRRVASSLSRAIEAGSRLTAGDILSPLDIPIIGGLLSPLGERAPFMVSVAVTAEVNVMGGQTTTITRSVIVSTDSVLSPAEIDALALAEFIEDRESQYDEQVDINSMSTVIEWAFRTFQ